MTDSPSERYRRAERRAFDLIETLPKDVLGQVARMLAQALAHHRLHTGVDLPIEATMLVLNSPHRGPLDREAIDALNAEALEELASLLAWQAGKGERAPDPRSWH